MYTFCREMGRPLHALPVPPIPLVRAEWQNYAMLLKAFKKNNYACYFIF